MKARLTRAIAFALIALGLLAAGAAPLGQPGIESIVSTFSTK
jgi:hypothetical protein